METVNQSEPPVVNLRSLKISELDFENPLHVKEYKKREALCDRNPSLRKELGITKYSDKYINRQWSYERYDRQRSLEQIKERHFKREENRKRKYAMMSEEEKDVIRKKKAEYARKDFERYKKQDVIKQAKQEPVDSIKAYPTRQDPLMIVIWGSLAQFNEFSHKFCYKQELLLLSRAEELKKVQTINPEDDRFDLIESAELKEWLTEKFNVMKKDIESNWLRHNGYYIPPLFAFRKAAEAGAFFVCQIVRDMFFIDVADEPDRVITWGPHTVKAGEVKYNWPRKLDFCKVLFKRSRSKVTRLEAEVLKLKMIREFA